MESLHDTNVYLADILESLPCRRQLTKAQIEEAVRHAQKLNVHLLEVLVERKLLAKKELIAQLAEYFIMPPAFPMEGPVPPEVIAAIPPEVARKYRVIPMARSEDSLSLAIADPLKIDTLDTLKMQLETGIEPMLALGSDIEHALKVYYPTETQFADSDAMLKELHESAGDGEDTQIDVVSEHGEEAEGEDAPVIKLVSLILVEAFKTRASDIHFEPLGNRFRVRYRIDGVLQEVSGPPKRLQSSVISRIKIMSGMSIAEKRLPQDGRIKINVGEKHIDLRVSSIPIVYGESIVLRILDKSGLVLGLAEMGFSSENQRIFESLISLPNGIILLTGPTGSGKTSTLYSALSALNKPNRKIITVEDPVEYLMSGINQVQVNEPIGRTFARVLRAILRQAPNIVMIGEIRDTEVAGIAINAALTGHLVFSTLHTNDAPSSVTRLIDQGVKPYLVASAIQGIVAQRLLRRICPKCRAPFTPPEDELAFLKSVQIDPSGMTFSMGKGCSYCNNTGYRGRTAIHEILVINDQLRDLVYAQTDSMTIKKRAVQMGMKTLLQDGVSKVASGITSLSELLKTTQE